VPPMLGLLKSGEIPTIYHFLGDTVDGRNPKQPSGMYKTL